MSNLSQAEIQKLQSEIQEIEKLLQSIQKEAANAQKRLNSVNNIVRQATLVKPAPTNPVMPKPQPKIGSSPIDIKKYKPYVLPDGSITYKTKDRQCHVPPTVVKKALSATTLKSFFEEFGLQVKDNRAKGGALWVKGSSDFLWPYVGIAYKKFGCGGTYTSIGRATGFQIGWFTKCMR